MMLHDPIAVNERPRQIGPVGLRFSRRPGLLYAEYSSKRRSGCGCCGCLTAPFLALLLVALLLVERFVRKLLVRV